MSEEIKLPTEETGEEVDRDESYDPVWGLEDFTIQSNLGPDDFE